MELFRTGQETSLAAVFRGPGLPLELTKLQVPRPDTGEAVVRIQLCTVCGSDLHTLTGARNEPTPSILGHEILGTVMEVGCPPLCDVTGNTIQVGDRVTWSTCISCFECHRCRSGLPQKCLRVAKYGHALAKGRYALSGGLAEFIVLRAGTAVIRLGNELPDEVACPVNCAAATAMAACRMASSLEGKRVLVLGAGMLGLTVSAYAKSHRASWVTVCDRNVERMERSLAFGADQVTPWETLVDEQPSDVPYDVVFECSGSPDAVETGCRLTSVGAKVILVGSVMASRGVSLDPERIVRNWLSIHGVHNYAPQDLSEAVNFLQRCHRTYPFDQLVEKTFPLASVNEAVEYALQVRPIRVAVQP